MSTNNNLKSPSIFIGKQEKGIVSFGSGQPDLPPPKEVTEDLSLRYDFRYGLIQGELELRKVLSKEYPDSTADNFIITNGASEALDLILRAMGSGKVLLPRPYYYSYPKIVEFAGMEPVYTNLIDGRIDLDDFSKKVEDCRVALINSPSNPTGRIEDIETLKEIENITRNKNIYIISDEVYKDLIYERENYHIKGDHVITINSFSKTYAMCGVRVGYLWSSDQEIVNKAIEIKTHTSMNTSLVAQDMALKATKAPKEYIKNQQAIWLSRRDLIYNGLRDLGFNLWKPEGAFYVFPEFKNPEQFVWDLYTKYNVIIYLGEWFGSSDRIRLSYALDVKEIEEGLNRIELAMKR
jgi:aspartate/methionine/tyrosine aminotransferase